MFCCIESTTNGNDLIAKGGVEIPYETLRDLISFDIVYERS